VKVLPELGRTQQIIYEAGTNKSKSLDKERRSVGPLQEVGGKKGPEEKKGRGCRKKILKVPFHRLGAWEND